MTEEEIKLIEDAAEEEEKFPSKQADTIWLAKICIKLHKRILELESQND